MKIHLITFSLLCILFANVTEAKYYERPDDVPFMVMSKALTIAKQKLKEIKKDGFFCKEAKNAVTNGGECWIFN